MSWRLNTDLAAGLFGLLFATIFWWSRGGLSPLSSIFPEAVLTVMTVVSVALVIKGFVRADVRRVYDEGNRVRLLVTTLILFAWWWLIGLLGFIVASVLTIFLLVWYLAAAQRQVGVKQLALWAVIVVTEVVLFYLVFSRLLYVRPPRGMFF